MTSFSSSFFHLPTSANGSLEHLVDNIEANPGDLIAIDDFDPNSCLNIRDVLATLPEGITEEDFGGILTLALLTESATESYEATIKACADRFDAPWLRRFVSRVWSPDEATHYAPYRLMLLQLGRSEAELDREISDTREREYQHYGGATPVHMTTFGMIQEYLTDNYHGLIAKLLRPAAPGAAAMVMRIKRRETLHSVWYRDMTALQIEADPRFIAHIASEIDGFHMPSLSLVPSLHAQGPKWQRLMGADSERLLHDMFRFVQELLQNTRLTGELVMRLASLKNINVGPLSGKFIERAFHRLGGPGYGIIGEAALERAGLSYMFAKRPGDHDRAFAAYNQPYERVRGLVRSWIASLLPPPDQVVMGAPA